MSEHWRQVIMVVFIIACTIGLRVLMELFCVRTERKIRLICVGGMMLLYTIVVTWELYIVGEMLMAGGFFGMPSTMSLIEYRNFICLLFPITNLLMGALIIFYCANIKKRVLSNREKIMLKDL